MPLRDLDEFRAWIKRESPSRTAQRAARHFLAEVGSEPWQSPSIPIERLSNQPEYEVRQVAVEVAGEEKAVRIWYRHIYATAVVESSP